MAKRYLFWYKHFWGLWFLCWSCSCFWKKMKKSKKKLSDFFRDQKFSSKQKQECLLLLSDEKIAWIIGNRPDDRFKITSFTSNIIQVSIL